ncbi:MAG: HlyD family type I secretion periplasmic adaptor subunit [Hyphomicrobiaceae bacterium]
MSTAANMRKRNRDELEFLPGALEVLETPPRPAARMTAMTICAFVIATLTWATLGRIDTVAVATGQIVPTSRVKLIQPLENGIVRAIHVREGSRVKAGDALIELDPTDAQANIDVARYELLKANLEASAAAALLTDDPQAAFKVPDGADPTTAEAIRSLMLGDFEKTRAALASIAADIAEQQGSLNVYEAQLAKAKQVLPLTEERLQGLEDLNDKQLVRKPDLYGARQQWLEGTNEIASASANIAQANARIEARTSKRAEILAGARADALQKRGDALKRMAANEQQLKKEEQRRGDRTLRAPVDGNVVAMTAFTVGGVVTTKDIILKIVPADAVLEIEAVVLNRDIGFVAKGQSVEIKLETFPFTKYGLIPGVVKEVWRDAIQDERQGLIYRAEITLLADKILVGDTWVPLAPGMSTQAEIKTGDRRVIEYFLSPFLRYKAEALRER